MTDFDTPIRKPELKHPFFGYDLNPELINTTKCPVPGCNNPKKLKAGICDECWERIPESKRNMHEMYKGTPLGDLFEKLIPVAEKVIARKETKKLE